MQDASRATTALHAVVKGFTLWLVDGIGSSTGTGIATSLLAPAASVAVAAALRTHGSYWFVMNVDHAYSAVTSSIIHYGC